MNTMKKCSTCGDLYAGDLCPKCMAGFAQNPTAPTQPPEELPLKPGQTFHGLEIVELLGKGGMGVVYKARQPALDRFVALKILPRRMALDPDFQNRFIREAKALGSLSHPNIVLVHDFGAEGDLFFFVMEFVDGVNLRNLLREKKLSPEQAFRIVPQLCDALEYAHGEGIVHRDIKPENILLDRKGRVKIADFGLAKLTGADNPAHMLTMTNMVMGTPHYMAPEQVENPKSVDHRADIYSMGVVFYEMLTGELPIGRFELPSKKVQIDVRLDEVVLKSLEKAPDRRYQKASDVKDAVTRATSVSQADSYSPTVMTPLPARKGMSLAAKIGIAAAVLLVLVLAGNLVQWSRLGNGEKPPVVVPPPPVREKVAFERIHFKPDETPGGYRWLPAKAPWRNPLPAKTADEIKLLVQYLDSLKLQNVAPSDLVQGYVAEWYSVSMLALESPIAERLEKDFNALGFLKNRWSWRQGDFLVAAFAARKESRANFAELVLMIKQKLGLPPEPPEMPVENLALAASDLPKGWALGDPGAVVVPNQAARTVLLAPGQEGTATLVVFKWPSSSAAQAHEKRLRALEAGVPETDALKRAIRHEVLRAANVVVALYHNTPHLGGFEKTAENVRQWMGHPKRAFETIVPSAAELPAGWTFDKVVTDPREAIEAVGLSGVQASDVRKAFHATLKPNGAVQVFEIAESKVKYAVENQLDKIGPAEYADDFVFGVQAPDDLSLDALENRMREKLGYDRNRPRYIKMADARPTEKELPEGVTLKPLRAEELHYEAELRAPAGTFTLTARSFNDYRELLKFAGQETPYAPGDLLLVKDFIVVHAGGLPEAGWGTLEAMEAALRRKMWMGPAALEDLLHGRGLPRGKTLDETAEIKGFAAAAKLDAALVRAAWKAESDTIDGFLLHAKDAKAAEALAKSLPGSWRKGDFVAFVRALDGAVPDDVKKLSEQLRGRLRVSGP